MKISKKLIMVLLAMMLTGAFSPTEAQDSNVEEEQLQEYEAKVKDIVTFLEYVLNMLGSKSTSARDKDVIINQSYTKIFRDSKVQIEDDLDENRDVITNKDVQAYLKDVDFFFKGVKFDFNIEDVSHYVNDEGDLFFKVTLTRNIRGIDIEGDSVNNTKKRYIEVNLRPESQDLKIASIYTNPYSQKEALNRWWNDLSYEWKAIFKRKAELFDSVSFSDIKNMSQIQELDISGNQYITNIEPLSQLSNLKRLDISHTNIEDLKPIRNLTHLEELNISNTQVQSLEPLKYAGALRYLDLQNTPVDDITTLSRLVKLQSINLNGTKVATLEALASLPDLKVLNIAATPVTALDTLKQLKNLEELNFRTTQVSSVAPLAQLKKLQLVKADSTPVTSLEPLSQLEALKVLSVNYTSVTDLSPLAALPQLERVYCDGTEVTKEEASRFMSQNQGVLVIFESEDLKNWWAGLSADWKEIFENASAIAGRTPTKEELAQISSLDSIHLSGNLMIRNLEPLSRLRKLETIIATNTAIQDIEPLQSLRNVEYLDISGTRVSDFSPLTSLEKLRMFKANNTGMPNLDPIIHLPRLREVEVDNTLINEVQVQEFILEHPECLIIFKTEYLKTWWEGLDPEWKRIFSVQTALGTTPSKQQLHKLIELEVIQFSDVHVSDLTPLRNFLRVKELRFSGTAIADLGPIAEFKSLEILQASRSPLNRIDALKKFTGLQVLDISNTPVDDLEPLSGLHELRELNCSGTQVRKLTDLDNLTNLQVLDCSNTSVKRLDGVEHLGLRVLKAYNTRLSQRRIDDFKQSNPDCNVIYY